MTKSIHSAVLFAAAIPAIRGHFQRIALRVFSRRTR